MRIYVIEMDCKEYQELKELQELKGLQKCTACNGTGKKQKIKPNPNKKMSRLFAMYMIALHVKGLDLSKNKRRNKKCVKIFIRSGSFTKFWVILLVLPVYIIKLKLVKSL